MAGLHPAAKIEDGALETGFAVTCPGPPWGTDNETSQAIGAAGKSWRVRAVSITARRFGTRSNTTVSKMKRFFLDRAGRRYLLPSAAIKK
jgi:hypothetical protein